MKLKIQKIKFVFKHERACGGIIIVSSLCNLSLFYKKSETFFRESCLIGMKGCETMKKILLIILSLILMLGLVACDKDSNNTYSFKAKVIETYMNSIIVEPLENEDVRRSADKISIGLGHIPEIIPTLYPVGTLVQIEYDGNIDETYPAQITAISLKTIGQENEENTIIIPNGKNEQALNHKIRIGKFVENTKRGIDDEITIVQYTIEGDPIIKIVKYIASNGTYEITKDTTADKFGSQEVTTKTYDKYYQATFMESQDGTHRYMFNLVSGTVSEFICAFVYQPSEAEEKDKNLLPGMIETGEFSYVEVWNNVSKDAPGVKMNGFINTEKVELVDVIERAKAEVTVDYNLAQKFYDKETDMWRVHFGKTKRAGGDENVYLDGNGVTQLIIYGE